MNYSLTQLKYLVAVDTYRNFAQAAEKCLVTQPTLSMQLRKMEEAFGISFFDRGKQPIVPTESGKRMVEQARNILRECAKFEEMASQDLKAYSGKVKMGVIPTIAPYLLPIFLGDLLAKFPGLELEIHEMKTADILEHLKTDELDCAILSTPVNEPYIKEVTLYYEEIKVFSNAEHPFVALNELTSDQLVRNDIWMLTEGNCFRNQVINLCSSKIQKLYGSRLSYQSGSLETLKKMVETEGGFTLLPELAVMDLSVRQLKQVKSLVPKAVREISLIYIRNEVKKEWMQVITNTIRNAIPKEMLDKERGLMVEWK